MSQRKTGCPAIWQNWKKWPNSIYILRDYCRNIYSVTHQPCMEKNTSAPNHPNSWSWASQTHQSKATFSRSFCTSGPTSLQFACWMEPPCGRTPYFAGKSMKIYENLVWEKTWKSRWMKTYSTASTCNIHQHLISDKVNFTSTRSLVGAQLLTNHPWKLCIHIHRHIALVYHP